MLVTLMIIYKQDLNILFDLIYSYLVILIYA